MENEREVAGLWCSQVLAYLSEFHDDELPPETVTQIEAHLAGCDWCEQFGTQFSAMIGELVSQLAVPEALNEETIARLQVRLRDR